MFDFNMWGQNLIQGYSYLGLFVVMFLSSATILIYFPAWLLIIFAGGLLNPIIVGLVSGLGSSFGELTSYYAGRGGNLLLKKKKKWHFKRTRQWFNKYGFIIIPIFAATPLPMDVLGLFLGTINYDVRKFVLGVLIGRIPVCLFLAYVGYFGWQLF